jgi:hypothetical protein
VGARLAHSAAETDTYVTVALGERGSTFEEMLEAAMAVGAGSRLAETTVVPCTDAAPVWDEIHWFRAFPPGGSASAGEPLRAPALRLTVVDRDPVSGSDEIVGSAELPVPRGGAAGGAQEASLALLRPTHAADAGSLQVRWTRGTAPAGYFESNDILASGETDG